jgi:hypothetical protein
MPDKYAYQADPYLTTALRDYEAACRTFDRVIVRPWCEAHPDTPPLWIRELGTDRVCIGFGDPGGPTAPKGLSRNRQREELIPKAGKVGAQWREHLDRLNQRPRLSAVFRRFKVTPTISRIDHSRLYYPGLLNTPDAIYITWAVEHPNPGPHLSAVPLSVYYAALEAQEELEAAAKAVPGGE